MAWPFDVAKLPIEKTIDLDWYKDYGVEVVESVCRKENYSDGTEIVNKTYMFVAASNEEMVEDFFDYSEEQIKVILTKLEQALLLATLQFNSLHDILVKPEGMANLVQFPIKHLSEFLRFTKELKFDHLFNLTNKGEKKFVFQLRRPWTYTITNICERCGQNISGHGSFVNGKYNDDMKVTFRARFNFGILNKDAKRIELKKEI